jgi:hypothetical protein
MFDVSAVRTITEVEAARRLARCYDLVLSLVEKKAADRASLGSLVRPAAGDADLQKTDATKGCHHEG